METNIFLSRNLYAIEIPAEEPDELGGTIVVLCGLDAADWITTNFCQYLTHNILWGQYRHLRQYANFIILPHMNPDGYEYR